MKQKGFAPVLVILLIVVLGVVGYLGYKNIRPSFQSTPAPAASVKPSPESVISAPDLVDGWKKYFNPKEGFSFSYPSDWEVMEDSVRDVVVGKGSDIFSVQYHIGSPYVVDENKDQLSQIEAHKEYYLHSTSFSDMGGRQIGKQGIRVDGKTAIKYTLQPLFANEPPGDPVIWIYVIKDQSDILQIGMGYSKLTTQEKILTTFRFTN